jgi:hypothetical protein
MKLRHLARQLALAGVGALAGTILLAGAALAQTATVTNTPVVGPAGPGATVTPTATPAATGTAGAPTATQTSTAVAGTVTVTPTPGTPTVTVTPGAAPAVPHDDRYFAQTGFRIDNDVMWDYFNRRGGVTTFGYPTSRTFMFRGFNVQFFQRRVVELGPNGARQLNLLDPGLLNYTRFNNATVPGVDAAIVQSAPPPNDAPGTLAFVQRIAPNTFNNRPVNFLQTFSNTVAFQVAFPSGGDPNLLMGINLEMWGVPTSNPAADPNNANFIYQRWQRGIMHYDAGCNCTQGLLLADYLKAILTGQNLPADVDQQSQGSPFYKQYDPTKPAWVRDPGLLPNTDLTNAFTQG